MKLVSVDRALKELQNDTFSLGCALYCCKYKYSACTKQLGDKKGIIL